MLTQVTAILYAFASLWQGSYLVGRNPSKRVLWLTALPAVCLHAYLLYQWIDIDNGQNLYFFNVFSLIIWMSAGLVLMSSLRKPVQNLLIFVLPLALISILLVKQFPGKYLVDTGANPAQFVHVILSTVTFSILCVAQFQALLLLFQDKCLRTKKFPLLLRLLPPVETVESLLFEIISLGFFFLTIVLSLSLMSYGEIKTQHLTHSPYLAILAWIVFAILLWGRYRLGWRGRTAIRWTMIGFAILVFSYFGNWLIKGILA